MRLHAIAVALTGLALSTAVSATDVRVLPAAEREMRSASGRFVLRIESLDGWKSPKARATLRERGAVRWSRTLPHELGPRSAAVADGGTVLLLDEWINILSRHAIMLVAPDGRIVADRDATSVIALLDVPPAEVSARARIGVWRGSEPVLKGGIATLRAGGKTLSISLGDGALSVRR